MAFDVIASMFQDVPIAAAFIGTILAAAFDLKTTEIPDEIPYVMIGIALVLYIAQALMFSDYMPILQSLFWGLGLLGFGFVMYHFGQWGGGDAKVLSAIGFLLPALPSSIRLNTLFPFPLTYSFNVFLVGAAYMIVYALVVAVMNRKVFTKLAADLKAMKKILTIGSAVLFASFIAINLLLSRSFGLTFNLMFILRNSTLPLLATLALFTIWKFAKAVEDIGFRKRIPLSKLKVGDVLQESKLWEGLTEKQLNKVKRSGKRFVVVKEGVRFAGAFPLALLFTFIFGDGLLMLIRFLI